MLGIKLRLIGSHLNMEVRVTPFNFISGKLIEPTNSSYWVGNDNTELSDTKRFVIYYIFNIYSITLSPLCYIYRIEIDISNSDLPTKSNIASEPDMSSNKFLLFTHSSIDRDVAQTTLPFIDSQVVAPYPGVPLSGVGVYFKGMKNYAGYIGPSVFTYDLSNEINSNLFPINNNV